MSEVKRSGPSVPREEPSVLLVEDTLDDALLVRTLLTDEFGYGVTLVQDGIKGCQLARHRPWSLVIADLNLPGRTGGEVIRASREAHPDTPVLAISGYPDQRENIAGSDVDEFLHKPLDRDQLRSAVARIRRAAGGRLRSEAFGGADRRVLAIGGLPGDVEIGCGGILLGHRSLGHEITVLVLSAGGDEAEAEARKDEAARAAELLGAELVLPDGFGSRIPSQQEMREWVREAARRSDPDVIYAPSPRDVRESRMKIHRAAVVCGSGTGRQYSYQTVTSTLRFHPTLFVDIARHLDEKLEVLASFRTGPSFRPHLQEQMTLATARYWGRFLGYTFAEPLEVLVNGNGEG